MKKHLEKLPKHPRKPRQKKDAAPVTDRPPEPAPSMAKVKPEKIKADDVDRLYAAACAVQRPQGVHATEERKRAYIAEVIAL